MPPSAAKPMYILSLDGAGARGVNELIILQHVMNTLRDRLELSHTPKPCEYFDLIGGTALGGLIAVMLGRLEMSVDDALKEYHTITGRIFSKENKKWITMDGHFKTSGLETEIKRLLKERGEKETATLLQQGTVSGQTKGLVVLCATSKRQTELLRSYKRADDSFHDITIWEAMRATCASGPLFKSFRHGNLSFTNADVNCVNPIHQTLLEAERIFGPEAIIGSIVSIGAGVLDTTGFAVHPDSTKVIPSSIQSHLVSLSYEAESTANELPDELILNEFVYFRLNVVYPPENRPFADEWNRMGVTLSQAHDSFRRDEFQKHLALLLDALSGVDAERLTLPLGKITSFIAEFYGTAAPSYESKEEHAEKLINDASLLYQKKMREDGLALKAEALQIYHELVVEDPAKHRPTLASALGAYAIDLHQSDRFDEAIVVEKEAVDIYEQLYAQDAKQYRLLLACILTEHALRLYVVGQTQEALDVGARSVTLHKMISVTSSHLARAFLMRSMALSQMGSLKEAISSVNEAIAICRKLPTKTEQQADLASCLSNLSSFSHTIQRHHEAHTAAKEAVSLFEKVVAADSTEDTYRSKYAHALEICVKVEIQLGIKTSTRRNIMQAVAIRRRLVAQNGDMLEQLSLARALSALSMFQATMQEYDASLASAQETLKIQKNIAKHLPDGYSYHLLSALCLMCSQLGRLKKDEEGLEIAEEALALSRRLQNDHPGVNENLHSVALFQLAKHQNVLKMHDEALTNLQEALKITKTTDYGSQFHYDTLTFIYNIHTQKCRHEKALEANKKSIDMRRRAYALFPLGHIKALVEAMTIRSQTLGYIGRYDEALTTQDEGLSMLVSHGAKYDAERANIMEIRAAVLREMQKLNESRKIYEELITLRRQLLDKTPESRDRLSMTLYQTSIVLKALGLRREALAYSQEHADILRELEAEEPGKFSFKLGRGLMSLSFRMEEVNQKQDAESIKLLEEAETLLRNTPESQLHLAVCLGHLGYCLMKEERDMSRAVAALQEALHIYEDFAAAEPGVHDVQLKNIQIYYQKAKLLVKS